MANDSCLEQKNFIPKKRRKGGRGRIKRKKIIKAKRRSVFFNIIFLIAIVITALITAFNFYISINCKDLLPLNTIVLMDSHLKINFSEFKLCP